MDGGDQPGGSGGLAGLIDEHGEAIYADLIQYYGINLVDALRDGSGYSPRQILVLIRQLPSESRLSAAFQGGNQFLGWGVDRYMQANLIDAVRELTFAFISANSKKKPKPPKPAYRPAKEMPKSTNPFRARLDAAKKQKG
jgi:hypothetical protein